MIIEQINTLISTGVLKPGDSLPSERALAGRFGVGRGYVREAIRKLEFYGILKTLPQRETEVANIGVKALAGLIANILNLDKQDMDSLMEARAILHAILERNPEKAAEMMARHMKMSNDQFNRLRFQPAL